MSMHIDHRVDVYPLRQLNQPLAQKISRHPQRRHALLIVITFVGIINVADGYDVQAAEYLMLAKQTRVILPRESSQQPTSQLRKILVLEFDLNGIGRSTSIVVISTVVEFFPSFVVRQIHHSGLFQSSSG